MRRIPWTIQAVIREIAICAIIGNGDTYLTALAPDDSLASHGIRQNYRLIFSVGNDPGKTFSNDQIYLLNTPDGVFAGPVRSTSDAVQMAGHAPDYLAMQWSTTEISSIGRLIRICPIACCNSTSDKLCREMPGEACQANGAGACSPAGSRGNLIGLSRFNRSPVPPDSD